MAPNYQISAGVMQKLLQGDPFPCDPIVVQLSYDAGKFRISDTSNLWASVTITGVAKEDLQPPPSDFKLYIILIRGYVTSEANANGPQDSILSLTNIDIVSTTNKRNTGGFQKYQLPTASISAGKSYDFWATTAHFLSESDLSGLSLFSEQNKADTISNFMKHNGAIETLKNVSHLPTAAINELYQTTLHDFGNSQRDRQQATLSSNTGRHDAATAATVAHQHSLALEQALDADLAAVLSPALFCSWHGILCNLHRHAGVIRPHHVAVRVGQVAFRPSRQVGNDLDQLSHALNALEIRLRQGLSPSLAAMSFAAAVVFSINDTHAFADGNGRLARLTANWALKRAGIPFCVALFATPAQRKEYVAAQIMTRRNLYLVSRGDVSQESLLTVFRDVGCLSPLVNLFVDRVYKAVTEFNRLVEEKALALSDEDDARAVRVFRESAATGNCLM
jgi:fido (protein-threonine AMPylation protein)